MKLRKGIALFLILIVLMLQLNFIQFSNVSNAQESPNFTFELNTSSDKVTKGNEFTITAKVKNLEAGIIAIGGKLEFDKNVLTIKEDSIKGLNSWIFSKGYYNLDNFKFITDSQSVISEESDVFEITFIVKEDVTVSETEINVSSVVAGTGELENGIAYSEDSSIRIAIEEEKIPEDITSNVYTINKENKTISNIPAETTIAQFKSNVTVTGTDSIVFLDNNGNVITNDSTVLQNGMVIKVGETLQFSLVVEEPIPVEEDITSEVYDINKTSNLISEVSVNTTIAQFKSNVTVTGTDKVVFIERTGEVVTDENTLVKTGMVVKVGETLQFTLVVKADADGDGLLTVNDIALMKLHYIEKPEYRLDGIWLKAVDTDKDERISINDVAQIKLLYIRNK